MLSSTNHLGAIGLSKNRVGMLVIEHHFLGNGIMGACSQVPRATPGQRLMGTPPLCLTFLLFHHYPHRHMSLHLHKTTSMENVLEFVWMGYSDPITISLKKYKGPMKTFPL